MQEENTLLRTECSAFDRRQSEKEAEWARREEDLREGWQRERKEAQEKHSRVVQEIKSEN